MVYGEALCQYQEEIVRKMILGKDHKRSTEEQSLIRSLVAETDIIPESTWSQGAFTRGQTQICTITNTGTFVRGSENWWAGWAETSWYKRMHHYNFPSYQLRDKNHQEDRDAVRLGMEQFCERAQKHGTSGQKKNFHMQSVLFLGDIWVKWSTYRQVSALVCHWWRYRLNRRWLQVVSQQVCNRWYSIYLSSCAYRYLWLEEFLWGYGLCVAGTHKGITAPDGYQDLAGLSHTDYWRGWRRTKTGKNSISYDEVMAKTIWTAKTGSWTVRNVEDPSRRLIPKWLVMLSERVVRQSMQIEQRQACEDWYYRWRSGICMWCWRTEDDEVWRWLQTICDDLLWGLTR